MRAHCVTALGLLAWLCESACSSSGPAAGDACGAPEDGGDGAACSCDAAVDASDGATDGDAADADSSDEDADTPLSSVRIMTFNIRHAELSSLEGVAGAIRAEDPDIVGLQEVDVDSPRSGTVDQAHRLSQLCGMASLFRTAIDLPEGGRYGLAILSRWPILSSESIRLTSTGEQRILVVTDLLAPSGATLPFAVTHLGLDGAEREQQAREIIETLADRPGAVLVGDLNATAESAEIGALTAVLRDVWPGTGEGEGLTLPADVPTRRVDYILLDPSWPTPLEAHVPVTLVSDHRPVVATAPLHPALRP